MGKGGTVFCAALFSKKGGVGRSYLASGLAQALGKKKKTLLVDLDAEVHTCDILWGLENEALYNLNDLISGTEPDRVVLKAEMDGECYLIPAPTSDDCFEKQNAVSALFDAARHIGAEYIVLDAPCRKKGTSFALSCADSAIVVSGFDPLSALAAEITAQEIYEAGKTPLLALNRFHPDRKRDYSAAELIDRTHARLIGVLFEESEIGKEEGMLLFDHFAARLTGEEHPLFDALPDAKKLRAMLL